MFSLGPCFVIVKHHVVAAVPGLSFFIRLTRDVALLVLLLLLCWSWIDNCCWCRLLAIYVVV